MKLVILFKKTMLFIYFVFMFYSIVACILKSEGTMDYETGSILNYTEYIEEFGDVDNCIPNATVAVRIAEIVWENMYGKSIKKTNLS